MEKNIASIYKITNKITGKIYIGFDSLYPRRLRQHLNNSKKGIISPLYNDIREYGWDNFLKELLYQSWDREHCLNNMEKYFIMEYNTLIGGYNQTLGGDGTLSSPRPKSEQWKKKHSQRMKDNNPRKGYIYSKEEKEKRSARMVEYYDNNPQKRPFGEKNGMFGKTHSEEWRKNHSEKMKNGNGLSAMIVKKPCLHCGKIMTLGNLKRWHNEKCIFNQWKKV